MTIEADSMLNDALAALPKVLDCKFRSFDQYKHDLLYTSNGSGELHKGGKIVCMASSDEGRTWSESRTILSPRSANEFDNWGLRAPTIVSDENRFVMFYSAWGAANFNCGDNPCGRRVGTQITEGSKCVYLTAGRAEQVVSE